MNTIFLISAQVNAYDFLEKILLKKFNILMPEIKKGEHGKPYFEKNGVYFNISHTDGLQAVAVGNSEVGVDVEKIKPVNLQVASRFTKEEYDYNMKDDSYNRFFEVWIKKEACLKYKGTGISGGLKSFNVFETTPEVKTFKYNEYVISVCSEKEFEIEVV